MLQLQMLQLSTQRPRLEMATAKDASWNAANAAKQAGPENPKDCDYTKPCSCGTMIVMIMA